MTTLLSVDSDPKTAKSNKGGVYLTAIQYLTPFKGGGFGNVCAAVNEDSPCVRGCLHYSGNPVYQRGKETARKWRTELYFTKRGEYKAQLVKELTAFVKRATKMGVKPAVRLNGTSDIVWEGVFPELFSLFGGVQFYDYTKIPKRVAPGYRLPPNYHLTFSRTGENEGLGLDYLKRGGNVAIVFSPFRGKPIPTQWEGYHVHDADTDDLRFLDPPGSWAGLRAKGPARKDTTSGWVVQV